MINRMILNQTSYFGAGAVSSIVDEIKKRGFAKALVVTDKDLIKFHVADKVTALLDKAGFAYEIFSDVKANPSVDVVKKGVVYVPMTADSRVMEAVMDTHAVPGVTFSFLAGEDVRDRLRPEEARLLFGGAEDKVHGHHHDHHHA